MDSSSEHRFPLINPSFRFHPHNPLFTYDAPEPTRVSAAVITEPRTPLSATTIIHYPISMKTHGPLAWMTTVRPPYYFPHPHRPATSTGGTPSMITSKSSSTENTITKAAQPAMSVTASTGIERGAKIGIALGISVTVLLSVIAVVIWSLDCRRRLCKRKEKRASRDSELSMWETELKDGRKGGLWDGLMVGYGRVDRPMPARRMGIWERVGTGRDRWVDPPREGQSVRPKSVNEVKGMDVPTQVPNDRTSVVSSVGSLGLPIMQTPIVPRSFLNGEERG